MIIGLVLILLATFFMFEIFQSLRDLDIAQATTVHYVNISEPLPQIPNDTLTSSIRRRINEVYGISEIGLDATIHDITANFNPKIMNFYKEYMRIQVHKLSHIQLFNDQDSTLRLFTLNSRWSRSKPYTDFALHILREERLYQINPREAPKSHRRVWKHGFYQRVNGIVETVSCNKEHDVIAAAVYNPLNKSRSLLYFNKLKYGYGKSMSTMDFSELYEDRYALGIDSNVNYEGYQDFASILGADDEDLNKVYEFNVYDTIPIEEDEKIENIAVSDGLIIYTTIEERMKLKYMLKTDNATWITKTFEYPITPVRYRIHKNIGMNFIFNAQTGEKQLLLTDLVANETDAQLIYYIFQPVQGSSLMHDEGARYPYLVNNTDTIDREKIYGTKSFEICRVNIPKELASIDVLSNFPRSIIKSNAATRQIIVVSLKKYVILISMESYKERSPPYQIKHFEDQEYKIKDVSIAEDGTYFSFLTYNKDREKVFIIQSKAVNAPPDNKLYLVAFDYSVSHNNGIKETQIVKSRGNDPVLLLLLETGEVATFSLEFGVMTWHGLRGLGAGDELDFLSLFSVALIIIIFIIAKIASSTRININLQRPR